MRWLTIIALLHGHIASADVCADARQQLDAQHWAVAEILVDQCAASASPPWLASARAELAPKLADMAAVEIESTPAAVEITVSTFPSDVRFAPRTIHLPLGTHTITATARDHQGQQHAVRVIDQMPIRVIFELRSLLPPRPPPPEPSFTPWLVVGAGAAVLLAGGIYHIVELEPEREALADAVDPAHDPDLDAYAKREKQFDEARRTTVAMYGLGVATVIVGSFWAFLEYRRYRAALGDAEVSATPTRGGAVFGLSWQL